MSTGQQLRIVKEEIGRIERFLPVMKRVLTMLRMETRNYRERVGELEAMQTDLDREWRCVETSALAISIARGMSAEVVTRPESLVGVDIDSVVKVNTHSTSDPLVIHSSMAAAAIAGLALKRAEVAAGLKVERRNLARLEDAEEEFVFLINGSEQVRLPPLYEQLSRLERALDEENGMAAAIARLLREQARPAEPVEEEEQWQLFA